jgi:hypothetical protein
MPPPFCSLTSYRVSFTPDYFGKSSCATDKHTPGADLASPEIKATRTWASRECHHIVRQWQSVQSMPSSLTYANNKLVLHTCTVAICSKQGGNVTLYEFLLWFITNTTFTLLPVLWCCILGSVHDTILVVVSYPELTIIMNKRPPNECGPQYLECSGRASSHFSIFFHYEVLCYGGS